MMTAVRRRPAASPPGTSEGEDSPSDRADRLMSDVALVAPWSFAGESSATNQQQTGSGLWLATRSRKSTERRWSNRL